MKYTVKAMTSSALDGYGFRNGLGMIGSDRMIRDGIGRNEIERDEVGRNGMG